jgi:hypothetical protein
MDVAKVDRDVSYVAMAVHVVCKRLFPMSVLFACLIISTFQLIFSTGTVFFSHNKLANSTFSHDFLAK